MGRLSWAVRPAMLVAAGAVCLTGCEGDPEDDFYGPVVYEVLPETVNGPFTLSPAFAEGNAWEYVDIDPGLAAFNSIPGKVYIMRGVEGQYPIIDALPGQEGYSPFWQVVEVSPPSGYTANQIKSLQTIEDAELSMTETDTFIHCPVINPDASWTSNAGVPLEALGLPPIPLQVIWNVDEDMPNALGDYLAQFGVDAAGFAGFLAQPDPETGWPGFQLPPELVALMEMRQSQPFLTDADASDLDVHLRPVWHKSLRGFCLLDESTDYAAEPDEFDDLQVSSINGFFIQFAPGVEGDPGDPKAEPPVPPTDPVEPAPYGLTGIYGAAPGSAGYSPLMIPQGVITATPEQATSASALDMANNLGQVADPFHGPLIRQLAPATVTPTPPAMDMMDMMDMMEGGE